MSMLHEAFRYTDEHHRQYETLGYCIFSRFLTDEAVRKCQKHIDRILGQLQPGRSPETIISAHQLGERWMLELATEPRLLDMIERQIGPNIVLWSTHLLCKAPQTGNPVPWHQDAPYWNISGKLAGGVWIPFDDVDAANGTMSILPGWHNTGLLPRRMLEGKKLFSEEIEPSALPADVEQQKVEYNLKAGQCAIHHTMIPHVSTPNRSNRWRRILAYRFMAADGQIGAKMYEDYRNGQAFAREFLLVRGKDVAGYGLRSVEDSQEAVH
jgi:hypothetical protein